LVRDLGKFGGIEKKGLLERVLGGGLRDGEGARKTCGDPAIWRGVH